MKKFKKLFSAITTAAMLLMSISSMSVSAEIDPSFYEDFEPVDMGTIQVRKGGIKNLKETLDFEIIASSAEDDSIIGLKRSELGTLNYVVEGLENGTSKAYVHSLYNSTTYIYTVEVSDQFSADLQLSKSELSVPVNEKGVYDLDIVDPYDDGWYNGFKGESVYDVNAKWASDNESVVTVLLGELYPKSVGTATVTATLDGVTYECKVTITEPVYQKGDSNMDDIIDLYDVIAIAKHIMDIEPFNDAEMAFADYNEDGVVDLYDAIAVAKVIIP